MGASKDKQPVKRIRQLKGFTLSPEAISQLAEIAESTGWTLSRTVEQLIKTHYARMKANSSMAASTSVAPATKEAQIKPVDNDYRSKLLAAQKRR